LADIDKYDLLSDLGKRRGFFWPSFEIYGGVSGYLDLGPLGAKLKRSVEENWLRFFVYQHGFVAISTPVITPEKVFIASGHVENFKDLMVTCLNCKRHFKADYAITEAMPGKRDLALEALSPTEVDSFIAENHVRCPECGGQLSKAEFALTMFKTNIGPYGEAVGYGRPEAAQGIFIDFRRVFDAYRERLPIGIAQVGTVMRNEISPRQGPIRLREFTIMEMELFFDPEEGSCEYLNRVKNLKLPILLAKDREQDRQEVTLLSIESLLKEHVILTEWGAYFMALSVLFVESLGVPIEKQRFEEKLPKERSHYSSQTFDHQIWLDRWGWTEIAGHAYRTNYDLSAHTKGSGADLSIFKPHATTIEKKTFTVVPIDSALGPLLREKAKPVIEALKSTDPSLIESAFERSGYYEVQGFKIQPSQVKFEEKLVRETGRRVVPHVVEPSFGAERIVYSLLEYSYTRNKDRAVLKLPRQLAPTKVAVFPLMAKDGLPEIGTTILQSLTENGIDAEYDEGGMIGRRYARADEIGVPLSITVDYQTKIDGTVTVRDRDSWRQIRRGWKELPRLIERFLKGEVRFDELGMAVKVAYD